MKNSRDVPLNVLGQKIRSLILDGMGRRDLNIISDDGDDDGGHDACKRVAVLPLRHKRAIKMKMEICWIAVIHVMENSPSVHVNYFVNLSRKYDKKKVNVTKKIFFFL